MASFVVMPWECRISNRDTTSRWDRLLHDSESSTTIERVLASIQCRDKSKLIEVLSELWPNRGFNLLKQIQQCACRLKNFFGEKRIHRLQSGVAKRLSFSVEEVASLIANAFFCTFEKQGNDYPDFTFRYLFGGESKLEGEKIASILRYFETIFAEEEACKVANPSQPAGSRTNDAARMIEIERRVLDFDIDWQTINKPLGGLLVKENKRIEDVHLPDSESWYADFADPLIGGRLFKRGCLQEEIRFSISPELIVSMLLCQKLRDREAVVVHNVRRFSDYGGYSHSFRSFALKPVAAHTKSDSTSSTDNEATIDVSLVPQTVFAIDALNLLSRDGKTRPNSDSQFSEVNINRELGKFFCGVCPLITVNTSDIICATDDQARLNASTSNADPQGELQSKVSIISGSWGCGAFGGDRELKTVIQLLATSLAGRSLVFCTLTDSKYARELAEFNAVLSSRKPTIGDCYKLLLKYSVQGMRGERALFEYLKSQFR